METTEYQQHLAAIKSAAKAIFDMAKVEEEVCRLEKAINNEVMYLAGVAQSDLVKPEGGWDKLGR